MIGAPQSHTTIQILLCVQTRVKWDNRIPLVSLSGTLRLFSVALCPQLQQVSSCVLHQCGSAELRDWLGQSTRGEPITTPQS
jgi:hypothetical protein